MKVIKPGKVAEIWTQEFTCSNCGAILLAEHSDMWKEAVPWENCGRFGEGVWVVPSPRPAWRCCECGKKHIESRDSVGSLDIDSLPYEEPKRA